jgi:hypothetical protein
MRFVMIRVEFIFSRFKSILLGASGEGFRKQTKEGKSLFTLRGLVSCDANKTSSELPLIDSLVDLIMTFFHSDKEQRFMYKINQGHLTVFCIVFV